MQLSSNEIAVWVLDHRKLSEDSATRFADAASDDEQLKAAAFATVELQRRYRVDHGFLREVIARYVGCAPRAIGLGRGHFGKPYIESDAVKDGIRFNLSHSGCWTLLAVAGARDIGIDVEQVRSDVTHMDIAHHYFAPGEISLLKRVSESDKAATFCQIWARKEAVLKTLGTGISGEFLRLQHVGMKEINRVVWEGREIRLENLDMGTGYAAAIAADAGEWRITIHRVENGDLGAAPATGFDDEQTSFT